MEWKKLLYKKGTIGIIAVLLLIQIFAFAYSVNRDRAETDELITDDEMSPYSELGDNESLSSGTVVIVYDEEEDDESDYEGAYKEKIQAIISQADMMSGVSIFSQADSYTENNLKKTRADFEKMLSVNPVSFDDEFLTKFFSFPMLNVITILAGVIISCVLVESKKPGLRSMIFSSKKGRGVLTAEKIGALILWDAVIVVVFYGVALIESSILYNSSIVECLNYPAQSASLFFDLPWKVNMGVLIAAYFVYRWIMLFFVTLLIWMVMFIADNMIVSGGVIGVFTLIEYLLYKLIGSSHPMCILKYCNIWYQMSGPGFFTEYKNLNIFSNAVNKNTVIIAVWSICILIMCILSAIIGIYRRPFKSRISGFIKRISNIGKKLRYAVGAFQERLSITGVEFYKILISQKGLLIIVVLLLFVISETDFSEVIKSGSQEMYYDFMGRHTGVPNEEAQYEIDKLEEELAGVEAKYIEAGELYSAGDISPDEYLEVVIMYEAFENDRLFLSQIKEQTEYIEDLKNERDIDIWYVNVYCYNNILDDGDNLQDILMIIAVVLLCSGVFSAEKRADMDCMMRQTVNGRNKVFVSKMSAACIITIIPVIIITGIHIAESVCVYGISGLSAPVQSIPSLSFIPFECTILVFLVIMYLVKFIVFLSVAALVCMFSSKVGQKTAVGLSVLLCVPAFLTAVGIEFFRYLSITNILSIIPFLLQVQSVAIVSTAVLVFVIVGIISMINGYKKWCIT